MDQKQWQGNKRHSGMYEYHGQSIQRRTSKKPSSKDRHGQFYPEGFTQTSIRAVTPDPTSPVNYNNSLSLSPFPSASLPTSPEYATYESSNGSHYSTPFDSSQPNNLPNSEIGEPIGRPRTRTLEERIRERSPTSILSKTRSRISSLQSSAPPSLHDPPGDVTSIGYPSIIPSPPLTSQSQTTRQRLVKPPPRPLSPIKNIQATTSTTPQSSPTTDKAKILHLMRSTCGRMHGILSFRTTKSGPWSSGYCAINVASGSLIYQMKGDVTHAKTLIPDLRGCKVRTMRDSESLLTYLHVSTHTSTLGIHLRPNVTETIYSWLAALLCWQPIRPKGVQNKMAKPQTAPISERRLVNSRRSSAINTVKDAAIIKVGKMLYWDENAQSQTSSVTHNRRISTYKQQRSMSHAWQKVSCTLQENGNLKLFTEPDTSLLCMIPLSSLSRYAIQRLEPSVLDDDFSLAIFPHYTIPTATILPAIRTTYLSLESRVLFEVWFVLLRAFTVPDLYGPEQPSVSTDLSSRDSMTPQHSPIPYNAFRVERLLTLRITEAKVYTARGPADFNIRSSPRTGSSQGQDCVSGDYYAEVILDGEIRARTALKTDTGNPFWREEYEFLDLPPVLSSALVVLKTRNTEQRDWTLVSRGLREYEQGDLSDMSAAVGDIEISPMDVVYGTVDLRLTDLGRGKDLERWWPICNEQEEVVGEMLMKMRLDEFVVLLSQDYHQLSEMMSSFSNGLTQQIAAIIPSDLKRLSDTLLNIFQVSGQASDWMMSLVEDEIDGIHKDTPVSRFRYSRRIASNDSYESGVERRELMLRDLGKSATVEANLLFRGNSLLTKALDSHMRRLGKEYLEDTLSERIRDIDESDPDCEVDPNRVQHLEDLQRNWRNLIALTENIWKSISASAPRCPPELRVIFRHIRACVEDRYGDFLRTVTYSSVSGFLFLRFFCPAVLNPKLFGLLKDHPRPRAQRTLTLIAKSLQTFANLNTFGTKEPWMEPMNQFLTSHRHEFKSFVDSVCTINSDRATSAIPPSYATPITILSRLPPTSKEGFPSLPYLIDQIRDFASLVDIWCEGRDEVLVAKSRSEDLKKFDAMCLSLSERTRECLNQAEQAERPSGMLEVKWQELIEQMDRKSRLKSTNSFEDQSAPSTPSVASDGQMRKMTGGLSTTGNSSNASLGDSYFEHSSRPVGNHGLTINGRNLHHAANEDIARSSSEAGFPEYTPPGSSSGVWDPGTQPLGRRRPTIPSAWMFQGDDRPSFRPEEDRIEQAPRPESGNSSNNSLETGAGSIAPRSSGSSKDGRRGIGDVWGFKRRRDGLGRGQRDG